MKQERDSAKNFFFLGFIRFRFEPVLMFQASVPAFKVSCDSNWRFETISNFQSLAEVVSRGLQSWLATEKSPVQFLKPLSFFSGERGILKFAWCQLTH